MSHLIKGIIAMKNTNKYTLHLIKADKPITEAMITKLLSDVFEVMKPGKRSPIIINNGDTATVTFLSSTKVKKNTTWANVIMDSVVFKHRDNFTRMSMKRGEESGGTVIFHHPFTGKGVYVTDAPQFQQGIPPIRQVPSSPNVPKGQRPINPYY